MHKTDDFFELYPNAVWEKDSKALLSLYHQDCLQFDMWERGFYPNLKEWGGTIEDWLSSLGNEMVRVEFEILQNVNSETTTLASGLIQFTAFSNEGKKLRSMKNRITLGFSRFDDGWKVIHQHISAPLNSSDLTAILDL